MTRLKMRACIMKKQWLPNQPISFIEKVASQSGVADQSKRVLFAELSIIDLQRHWQNWSQMNLLNMTPKEALREFYRLPNASRYLELSSKRLCIGKDRVRDLLKAEYLGRAYYGDLPNPVNVPSQIRNEYRDLASQAVANMQGAEFDRFEAQTWGRIRIGRQDHESSRFPAFEDGKLVCAQFDDNSVSRNQAEIQLLSKHYCVFRNTSICRDVWINSNTISKAGTSQIANLPLTVKLGTVLISVER